MHNPRRIERKKLGGVLVARIQAVIRPSAVEIKDQDVTPGLSQS
jgi:hypothetical protein